MKRIKFFWIMCLECREKSMVNIEFDQINMVGIFNCYNCKRREALLLSGTEPPIDKEHFTQQSNKRDMTKRTKN